MAMGRAMDEQVIEALLEMHLDQLVILLLQAVLQVLQLLYDTNQKIAITDTTFDVDGGSSTSLGLTVGKLIHARKILGANEADDYDVNGNSNLFF